MGWKICIYLKSDLIETKLLVWEIITIKWVTCVQNNFQIWHLIKQLLAKYFFQEFASNFTYSQKMVIFKYSAKWFFLDRLLLPNYRLHDSSMIEMLFFNFASCEPLNYGLKYYLLKGKKMLLFDTNILWARSTPIGLKRCHSIKINFSQICF